MISQKHMSISTKLASNSRAFVRAAAVLALLFTANTLLAQSDAQKVLERFKSMTGTWQGKSATGESYEVTYQLVAGGASVMTQMHMLDDDMTSMYYVNGDDLLMTHFCPTKNQPRMKATISADLNTVSFDFMDATNMKGPNAGHMHRAVFTFSDTEHYAEEWTWKQQDKSTTIRYEMQRKK
jgi:hypothetical protein